MDSLRTNYWCEGEYMGSTNISLIFKFLIIGIIYVILFLALRIMYKDIKGGSVKKKKNSIGLEVISIGENDELKHGGIIPIQNELTIGRKDNNLLVLSDKYVSSHHASIYLRNNDFILEDKGSTNGTYINNKLISGKRILKIGDKISIGTAIFRVIG